MALTSLSVNLAHENTPIVLIVMPEVEELETMSNLLRDSGYADHACARNATESAAILARRPVSIVLANFEEESWKRILQATLLATTQPRVTFGFRFSLLTGSNCDMVLKEGAYSVLGRPYCRGEVRQMLGFASQARARESAPRKAAGDACHSSPTHGRRDHLVSAAS